MPVTALAANEVYSGTLTISGTGPMYDGHHPWHNIAYIILIPYLVIEDGVTSIGDYAFEGCYQLNDIIIPGSVDSIGNFAFALCNGLESITIPDSVTSIEECTFQSCARLTEITIPESGQDLLCSRCLH